jgi:surfeit locus 1 family protein
MTVRGMLRWVHVLPALAAILVIATTVSLGNWQMRRAAEKAQLQAAIDAALAAEPIAIGEGRALGPEQIGGRLVLRGRWLDQYAVYIDNRTWRGRAGFHLLTPVKIEGSGQVALVLRGWLPGDPANRSNLPALPVNPSVVMIEARVEPDLPQALELARSVPPGPADRLWQNASIASVAAWSGLALAPVLLRQTAEGGAGPAPHQPAAGVAEPLAHQPGVGGAGQLVRDWPAPGAGTDKHRAYAVQWYALAGLTAVLWLGLTLRQLRRNRP